MSARGTLLLVKRFLMSHESLCMEHSSFTIGLLHQAQANNFFCGYCFLHPKNCFLYLPECKGSINLECNFTFRIGESRSQKWMQDTTFWCRKQQPFFTCILKAPLAQTQRVWVIGPFACFVISLVLRSLLRILTQKKKVILSEQSNIKKKIKNVMRKFHVL